MKMSKLNISFALLFAITVILVSCVPTKKYEATVADLNLTKQKLEVLTKEQVALKDAVNAQQQKQDADIKTLKKTIIESEYRVYKTARLSGDYNLAALSLTRITEMDSANAAILYDSLAWYHYFYLYQPGAVRAAPTAMFYTKKGLAINPNNIFLLEIKAKLDLEEQRDTMSKGIFQRLYNRTHDITYLWDIAFIELYAQNNIKKTDSIINSVISKVESEVQLVRLEHLQERIQEKVAAKSAFLYLRAVIQAGQNNRAKAMKTLEEAIKYSPNFYYARLSLEQLKNPQQQRGY